MKHNPMKKAIIAIAIMTFGFFYIIWLILDLHLAWAASGYSVTNGSSEQLDARVYRYRNEKGKAYIVYFPKHDWSLVIDNGNELISSLPKHRTWELPGSLALIFQKSEGTYYYNVTDWEGNLFASDCRFSEDTMWTSTFEGFKHFGWRIMVTKQ